MELVGAAACVLVLGAVAFVVWLEERRWGRPQKPG